MNEIEESFNDAFGEMINGTANKYLDSILMEYREMKMDDFTRANIYSNIIMNIVYKFICVGLHPEKRVDFLKNQMAVLIEKFQKMEKEKNAE